MPLGILKPCWINIISHLPCPPPWSGAYISQAGLKLNLKCIWGWLWTSDSSAYLLIAGIISMQHCAWFMRYYNWVQGFLHARQAWGQLSQHPSPSPASSSVDLWVQRSKRWVFLFFLIPSSPPEGSPGNSILESTEVDVCGRRSTKLVVSSPTLYLKFNWFCFCINTQMVVNRVVSVCPHP